MLWFKKKQKEKEITRYGLRPSYYKETEESEMIKKYSDLDNRLYQKYGKCRTFNKKIKLLVFADTHGNLGSDFVVPDDIDACILLGDISKEDIENILNKVPLKKVYGILGNHDYCDNLSKYNIKDLNKKTAYINGVLISGIEGCVKYRNDQAGYSMEEGFLAIKELAHADILVSHASPFGITGYNHAAIHMGLPYINNYLIESKCPINICGHNHVQYQKNMISGTKVIGTYLSCVIEIDHDNIRIL